MKGLAGYVWIMPVLATAVVGFSFLQSLVGIEVASVADALFVFVKLTGQLMGSVFMVILVWFAYHLWKEGRE